MLNIFLVQLYIFILSWPITILKTSNLIDQLAYLKKLFNSISKVNLAIKMALSSCFYYNLYQNLLINPIYKKFIKNFSRISIKNSDLLAFTFYIFFHIPTLKSILIFSQNLIFTLALVNFCINNKLFKQSIKAYLST